MEKQKKRVGSIDDPQHKQFIMEKQRLQILESAGKITESELKEELKELDVRINFNVQQYIEGLKKRDIVKKEKTKEESNKMEEARKVEKPVKTAKVKKVTNTDIIIDLLQRKSLKSVVDIVAKFKEKKPEAVEKNVKQQVTEIIAWVKKGHKKYADYTWNAEDFLLIPKE